MRRGEAGQSGQQLERQDVLHGGQPGGPGPGEQDIGCDQAEEFAGETELSDE